MQVSIAPIRQGIHLLQSYLTITLRNLQRNKLYAGINIIGLAIGLACSLTVIGHVQRQYSYNKGHHNLERIYQIVREKQEEEGTVSAHWGTSGGLAPALREAEPGIEHVARMFKERALVNANNKDLFLDFCVADPQLLNILTLPFALGDPATALTTHQGLIITESIAVKFFGPENPIGKPIQAAHSYLGGEFVVTGVVKDSPHPSSGRLQFDCLTATLTKEMGKKQWTRWERHSFWRPIITLVMLRQGADISKTKQTLAAVFRQHLGEELSQTQNYRMQPLQNMRFSSSSGQANRTTERIYNYISVVVIILLIACINYANLATAQSLSRSKEIGMRQVIGATRREIILQFLTESCGLAFIALIFAFMLATLLALPIEEHVDFGLYVNPGTLWQALPYLFPVALLTGLIAGIYPAIITSSFAPIAALQAKSSNRKSDPIKVGLVIIQFVTAILLIIITVVIQAQVRFLSAKPYDISTDNIIYFDIFRLDTRKKGDGPNLLTNGYQRVKDLYLQHPDILKASATRFIPSRQLGFTRELLPLDGSKKRTRIRTFEVDEDFIDLLGLKLVYGRNFSQNPENNSTMILNQSAVKLFGWDDPTGQQIEWGNRIYTVIGVIEDFQNRSWRDGVAPSILVRRPRLLQYLMLKIRPNSMHTVRPFLKQKHSELLPTFPFEYRFLQNTLLDQYGREESFQNRIGAFSVIAILLASLGLYGLAAFTITQRTREIGIRKTLGASNRDVVILALKDFSKWVLIATLIACPIAYFYLNDWLSSYAHRIALTPTPFLICGGSVWAIALLTVIIHALKASRLNPVDTLRQE